MANNRLYIVDIETGEKLLLAKTFGHGWYLWYSGDDPTIFEEKFNKWMENRDADAAYTNTHRVSSKLILFTENENDTGEFVKE